MESIACHFCNQLRDEPVLLQCKHAICSKCVQTQFSSKLPRNPCDHFQLKAEFKQKEGNEKIHDEKKTINICCPKCNEKTSLIVTQGITNLIRDMELAEKVKNAQETKVIMCSEECGEQATLYCEDCKENCCKECFNKRHSVATRKNHKVTKIDGNSPPPINSAPLTTCSKHGHLLDMFYQRDQVACCYKCFESGEHEGHESTFVSHSAEIIKKEISEKLTGIDEQINRIRQTLCNMDNLKEQMTLSHKQFREQVTENFDRVITQLVKKKDSLIEESKKMEGSTLSNIMLQQQALRDLLKQKTDMVAQANKWLSGSDLEVCQCKQLLQRNQEIMASMLICCESGKLSTTVDVSPVEQVIDKLGSIMTIPMDLKLPTISGLKECQQGKESVTIQWDPVKSDFSEMYFVVQSRADNDDSTVKNFKIALNVTSLQVPVVENWKQLMCTVQCALGEQFQGEKCAPLTVDLIGDNLRHLKEKCSQTIYERVQQVFNQKGTRLDLTNCNIDGTCAIAVAKMLPYLTQLLELFLGGNQIGNTGATTLASSIRNLTQLQELNLEYNQIGDIGTIALSDSITQFTQLQRLSLYNNQIGDTGAIAIANSIANLTQLQGLGLSDNRIGDTGAISIANSLINLTQLQTLLLHSNQIGHAGATALGNSLSKLNQLDCLFLFHNNISQSVKQQLQQQFGNKLRFDYHW